MSEPIFRLVRVWEDPSETLLGFEWIEVLAIVPCRAERLPKSESREAETWVYDSSYLCRTEVGIFPISEMDLLSDMDAGAYVEARSIVVWDVDHKTLKPVESVCVNGLSMQFNVEKWGKPRKAKRGGPK